MKLSEAVRNHLMLWREMENLNAKLAKKGLSIEAKPCLDPETGSVRFENARVIIDVKLAIPKLADLFIENGLPMPIDPTDSFDGSVGVFDPSEPDDELSQILGFDPADEDSLSKFVNRASGKDKGFDVVADQPHLIPKG